jgi:hypothetical protein
MCKPRIMPRNVFNNSLHDARPSIAAFFASAPVILNLIAYNLIRIPRLIAA